MEASDVKRLKELEEESRQLKAMFADFSLEHKILKDIVEKAISQRLGQSLLIMRENSIVQACKWPVAQLASVTLLIVENRIRIVMRKSSRFYKRW